MLCYQKTNLEAINGNTVGHDFSDI